MTEMQALLLPGLGGLLAGFLLGLVHFGGLRHNTRLYMQGRAGAGIALQLGRLALVAAGFTGLALLGPVPLLAGTLGLLAARRVVLRRTRAGGERA
ncbi:ATP synthase subunit I [Oceanicella sp. SM1341]|uniref:N-ATPase subunit AtpR n=1 Tax=Oceanicella sp. SM1341 TaxID=1548889 RepID=UPI000E532EA3|nr:ATP synthase subunit I [Oceanicella sp. SM1341]